MPISSKPCLAPKHLVLISRAMLLLLLLLLMMMMTTWLLSLSLFRTPSTVPAVTRSS